jgi:hypothetical protein
MKRHFTTLEIQRIVRLRMNGQHPEDIAVVVDRTKIAIDRLLSVEKARNGHVYPKLKHSNAKWNDYAIECLAMSGKRYAVLVEEYGISKPRISALMAYRAHRLQEGTWAG